jgi:DNA-binding transcriptional regulator PaaX
MSSKKDYSNKILRILGQKTAISVPEIINQTSDPSLILPLSRRGGNQKYAITRSLKGLRDAGMIERIPSSQNEYARLTKEGKKKMHSLELDNETTLVNTSWDGFWRIILLDLPENRKSERESLRYLLKKAGFVCLKNSAWISPFPYEHLFTNIKRDLGLTTEMMIIVTEFIDEESKKVLFETFGK